jgi:addiction module HigA family antidote
VVRTPIRPGEHLAEELKELSISATELARQIDVPVNQVTGIINGQRAITADTAIRSDLPSGRTSHGRRALAATRWHLSGCRARDGRPG